MSETLYTVIGAILGFGVGIVPTIKEIAKSGGNQKAREAVFLTTFLGSIIVGGAIGKALYEEKPAM